MCSLINKHALVSLSYLKLIYLENMSQAAPSQFTNPCPHKKRCLRPYLVFFSTVNPVKTSFTKAYLKKKRDTPRSSQHSVPSLTSKIAMHLLCSSTNDLSVIRQSYKNRIFHHTCSFLTQSN